MGKCATISSRIIGIIMPITTTFREGFTDKDNLRQSGDLDDLCRSMTLRPHLTMGLPFRQNKDV
jgi:hypothetical protein